MRPPAAHVLLPAVTFDTLSEAVLPATRAGIAREPGSQVIRGAEPSPPYRSPRPRSGAARGLVLLQNESLLCGRSNSHRDYRDRSPSTPASLPALAFNCTVSLNMAFNFTIINISRSKFLRYSHNARKGHLLSRMLEWRRATGCCNKRRPGLRAGSTSD
jgi:hypothetical protein